MRRRQISPDWWTAGACTGLVVVEAAVILVGFDQANRGVLGGDGPEYTLYAFNLGQHSAFSIAAVLCATWPGLLWYATLTMTEVLATACATLLTLAVVVARQRPSARNWALVGLALAAEAYVRPEYAGLLVVFVIAAAMTGASRWRVPLALGLAFLAAIAPWTARNASVTHRFVPLDAGTGVSLSASAELHLSAAANADDLRRDRARRADRPTAPALRSARYG
jgi:uncharacterized membrane protein YecN with MAPEG domain